MAGVSYALADFVTGGPILELPVMEGASWGSQLNRPDEVSCSVDMNDPAAHALDLRSSSEPNKTLLLARTDDDVVLAWGLIGDDGREWDEDSRTLSLSASGISSSFFGKTIVAPAGAKTGALIVLDSEGFPVVNPAHNTNLAGLSLGTIGKRLVAARLAWPGAPTVFDLPPDEAGVNERAYLFSSMKSIGSALSDLTGVENGPDFAFYAQRGAGLGLRYVMVHGSAAKPRIGTNAGSWHLGEGSPITGLKVKDAIAAGASAGWMTAGKQSGAPLISRVLNPAPLAAGYPPLDVVDTSHSDVSVQATLDAYNAENVRDANSTTRDLSFTVRADATPALGAYRPGDTMTIDVPDSHPWLTTSIPIRITSISGDEAGLSVKIGCVILDA